MYKIRVFSWNPNGTNDIEIFDADRNVSEYIEEATFGIDTGICHSRTYSLNTILKNIAVSPVSDGSSVLQTLQRYFKGGA